ncbi:protein lin-54 homolog isoform X1 [Lytechinus variegatus]|uniref:protein lin-54 homolog isoform X1 n=1 Tax=Lytechinus variegatus TaxID=7654 RepID=UPI001BB18F6A|nr:protein lin-54 homolog isoform X1 [Lytechinus variegatus]XP_041485446.1 protein lin-54 homolog isoform X1 [Lytechinus variegatus]
MAANGEKTAGETNGSEASGNILIKPDGDHQGQSGNQAAGTVRLVSGATGGGGGVPVQVLTPQMLASLSQQGLIIQNDGDSKGILQAVKRALPSSSAEQTVTKVVITRNPGNKTSSANASGTNPSFKLQGDSKLLGSGSPIKVITVSQGSNIPKGVVIASSPSKQTIAPSNKIALPPVKSPGKTIMLASSTTPKKIAPASNSGTVGQTILVKGSMGSTPGTITLSSGAVAKVINVMNTTVASSQVSGVAPGSAVPVQIHTAGQVQPQLTPGVTTLRPAGNLPGQGNVQAVSMPGKSFPIVRLVTVSTNTTTTATQAKPVIQLANAKPIAPAPVIAQAPAPAQAQTLSSLTTLTSTGQVGGAAPRTINIPIAPAQNVNKGAVQGGTGNQPRFIMPANAQVKIINAGKLAPGTTLLSAGGNLLQSYAVIPAHYLSQTASSQAQATTQSSSSSSSSSQSSSTSNIQPSQPQPAPIKHPSTANNGMLAGDGTGNRPRKPCNCTKSQCLKLYCDCFANGEFCRNCNCNNCLNNLDHEDERTKAVKACLDRNPMAFHPKIGKGQNGQTNRRHNKGCNCKRSGCLKNYCECYEAKILCSSHCKCVGCKNFEESPERKTLMHLADAAEVRVQQQTAARTKLSSQLQDYPTKTREFSDTGERLPFSFITKEVAEATLQCLMAQADESERSNHSSAYAESLILEEFGRCILQVIHSASKAKGVNPE